MPHILLYPAYTFQTLVIVLETQVPTKSGTSSTCLSCSFLDIGFVLTVFEMDFEVSYGMLRASRVQLSGAVDAADSG